MTLPYVKIDFSEKTVFWEPWEHIDKDEQFYADTDNPFDAYTYYFCWYHPYRESHGCRKRLWGYEAHLYDCMWFECFSFGWFNWSWCTASGQQRCDRRQKAFEKKQKQKNP
jgi:hypothetical protein